VNAKRLFRNEYLQLIEWTKKLLFQLGNESCAALAAEIQDGQDDDQIEVSAIRTLPDTTKRKVALQDGQTAESVQQALMHVLEYLIGYRSPIIIG
jgi:transcriptional antiterminator